MENELAKAYSEVYEVLKYIPMLYLNKIPEDVLNIFKNKRDKNYKVSINPKIPLEDQDLQRKTLILLSVLNLDYWCNPEEREEILNIYWKNEKEACIIVDDNSVATTPQTTSLTLYGAESFIEKIWNKLKNIFRRDSI